MILIVVPTIPGREESLARCVESYMAHTDTDYAIRIYRNSPSAGEGWLSGVAEHVAVHGPPDYVALTNDDCEVTGEWWPAAVEACDAGKLPAPIVLNTDGSLQSAGGDFNEPSDLIHEIRPDWAEVGFTTIPFMSWEQWERVGMVPLHYCSDCWVSERGRQLGIPTVLRHGYRVTHHLHQVGRINDATADRSRMQSLLNARSDSDRRSQASEA